MSVGEGGFMTREKKKRRIWLNLFLIICMMVVVATLPAKLVDLMDNDDIFD